MICAGVGGETVCGRRVGVGVGHGCGKRCTGNGTEEVLSILGSAAMLPA